MKKELTLKEMKNPKVLATISNTFFFDYLLPITNCKFLIKKKRQSDDQQKGSRWKDKRVDKKITNK